METVFLANHVVLEGFDDISKAEEYKKDFGDEIAGKLENFSDTKMKVVKQDETSGRYIGRFKQLKDMKPKVDVSLSWFFDRKGPAFHVLDFSVNFSFRSVVNFFFTHDV